VDHVLDLFVLTSFAGELIPSQFEVVIADCIDGDLAVPAITRPWLSAQNFQSWRAFDDWFTADNLKSALARPGQVPVLAWHRWSAAMRRIPDLDG
jgi:hypothetical protein